MSISGPGLYQDDTGFDVRATFRESIADGMTAAQARERLLAEWAGLLEDADQACAFWLALADTQSRTGRLEDDVRDRALQLIDSGLDLARFEYSPTMQRKRRVVLEELRTRLVGPQRSPLKIRKPFRSTSPVGIGDVFTYTFPSGRLVWLRCLAIQGDQLDNSPVVEVLDWNRADPPRDPERVPALEARLRGPDRFWMARYASDPDPSERIRIYARHTRVTRGPLPSLVVTWPNLEATLTRDLGLNAKLT